MKTNWIFKCIGFGVLAVLGFAAFGYIVMLLWNWLMPAVFGLKIITYCEAFGILILSKILFGGFRGRCCGGKWGGHRRHYWKEKMEAKMASMTSEEREKFKLEIQHKYGKCWGGDWENKEVVQQ